MILEAIVAVLVVVGVGWAISVAISAKQPTLSLETPAVTTTPRPTTSTTPAASAREFDIPELALKLTAPAGLSGLEYQPSLNQIATDQTGAQYRVSTVGFSTTTLAQADNAGCGPAQAPLGQVAAYGFDPRGKVKGVTRVKRVGASYVAFVAPVGSCSTTSSAANALQRTLIPELSKAYDTITGL